MFCKETHSPGLQTPCLRGSIWTQKTYPKDQTSAGIWKTRDYVPSRELRYPPKNGILKIFFLFPRWDMLVPWRVPLFSQKKFYEWTTFSCWIVSNTKNPGLQLGFSKTWLLGFLKVYIYHGNPRFPSFLGVITSNPYS